VLVGWDGVGNSAWLRLVLEVRSFRQFGGRGIS